MRNPLPMSYVLRVNLAPEQSSQGHFIAAQLGIDGPEISRVGFGAWAVGGPYENGWGPSDDETSISALLHAVERGVTWVDTAPAYGLGHSEEVVGAALKRLPNHRRPMVFTKCGRTWLNMPPGKVTSDLRPESIRRECDASLQRLGVDRIDLYQIHRPDVITGTPLEDSWGQMSELVAAGKVRAIGVSNFDPAQLDVCEMVHHVTSVQPRINLLDSDGRQIRDWCAHHGAGLIAYSPLASGLLTGSFDTAHMDDLAADDWRKKSPKFSSDRLDRAHELTSVLKTVADDLHFSIREVAIAWVLAQSSVTAAIVGARSAHQVEGWVEAAQVHLSPAHLEQIEAARQQ